MPYKPKRKCNQFGCKALTRESYCPKHEKDHRNWSKPTKRKDRTPDGRKVYDERWRRLRNAFLSESDNALCVDCERRGIIKSATEVDHIKPIAERPDLKYDERNLQPLCKSCHSRKTAYEYNIKKHKANRKPLVDMNPE